MPGGSNYRKWYAMKKSMEKRGKWTGNKKPTHSVPEREEGEPAPKEARVSAEEEQDTTAAAEENPATPDSLPELEQSPTPEGR